MQPEALKVILTDDFNDLPEDFMIECCETEGMPFIYDNFQFLGIRTKTKNVVSRLQKNSVFHNAQ